MTFLNSYNLGLFSTECNIELSSLRLQRGGFGSACGKPKYKLHRNLPKIVVRLHLARVPVGERWLTNPIHH